MWRGDSCEVAHREVLAESMNFGMNDKVIDATHMLRHLTCGARGGHDRGGVVELM